MSNVINIFAARKQIEEVLAEDGAKQPSESPEFDFAEAMRRNKEKQERLRLERAKANSSVTKSHRLKN